MPKDQLNNAENWLVNAYTYVAKASYGGPKIPRNYKDQVVAVKSVTASEDGKRVELVLNEERKPNHVYHIRIDAKTADGEPMWSPESWVTFHKSPRE